MSVHSRAWNHFESSRTTRSCAAATLVLRVWRVFLLQRAMHSQRRPRPRSSSSESWSASSELPSMEPKVLKHTARADAVRLAARPS